MKESKLLGMQNKIQALTNVIQQMISELNHLRELSIGTLETVKLLPGYEEAIEQLKSNMLEKNKEEKEMDKLVKAWIKKYV